MGKGLVIGASAAETVAWYEMGNFKFSDAIAVSRCEIFFVTLPAMPRV